MKKSRCANVRPAANEQQSDIVKETFYHVEGKFGLQPPSVHPNLQRVNMSGCVYFLRQLTPSSDDRGLRRV